jgi:hypothetical protein
MRSSVVLVLALLLLSVQVMPQDRYVVRGKDAIPIPKGKSSLDVAFERGWVKDRNSVVLGGNDCPTGAIAGNTGGGIGFAFTDGDVELLHMVAPVTGVIESVYFRTGDGVAGDSGAVVRIFESAFSPSNPEPAGTGWYGYYPWPSDPNNPEAPNDPWNDTPGILPWVPGDANGFDPNGAELWGFGGYVTTWHTNTANGIAMNDLGVEPNVTAGDYFNVCIRVPSVPDPGDPTQNVMDGSVDGADPADFLKYYYRGRLMTDIDVGWWGRVEYNMSIWAVIRASGNLPPIITSLTDLNHTTSTGSQTVCVSAFDCNPSNPSDTGVVAATLNYSVDGGAFNSVAMTGSGPWCADIPGMGAPASIAYYVVVEDNLGDLTESNHNMYRVVNYTQNGYVTSFPAFSWIDISGTGTPIPPAGFFAADGMTQNTDDGTAGPLDLGSPYFLFGAAYQYAWVGANGAIALTATAAETPHVNSGGFFSGWVIPENDPAFPQTMIMGFWNDLWLDDGMGTGGSGNVYYQNMGNGMFVIQWELVGNFNDPLDRTTFEIILDQSDPINHAVYFQYEDVGTTGLDLSASTGLQGHNTIDQWLLVANGGYPTEGVPANSKAIYMLNQGRVDVGPIGGETPEVFALKANYPNPFNPATNIEYSIPTSSFVTLTVYDALGREVATLVKGEQEAGNYLARFDASNLANGTYFYRLSAGGFLDVRKMILLK